MQTVIDEGKLKQVFKEAMPEMLEERKSIFQEMIAEAMEDIALTRAICESEQGGGCVRYSREHRSRYSVFRQSTD